MFGPVKFAIDGLPLAPFRSRKALWLGAYLVLAAGKAVPRERLAHALWPDSDTKTALANLRAVVSDFRKALGREKDRLRVEERNRLLFDLDGVCVDVLEFDRAVSGGNFESATELYRGVLLEDCREDWAAQERSLRHERAVNAHLALGDRAIREWNFDAAVECYREAVKLEPLREEGVFGLMTTLADRGDVAEATYTYRTFADQLRREVGLGPGSRISDTYLQIRNGKWKRHPNQTTPPQDEPNDRAILIPHPLTEIVGREEELAEIASMLRQSRLVTLTGVGGVGKTRLAIQAAHDLRAEFPDGVVFLALDSLNDEEQVVRSISKSLGLRQEAGEPFSQNFVKRFHSKKMLLIWDNCEHLIAQCLSLAGDLLNGCGDLRVLLTSRHALVAPGERIFTVPGLSAPVPEQLPANGATRVRVATSYEGVALFAARAKAADRDFAITADNARLVSRICSELEGIPLAIELAAAQVGAIDLETIADQLSDLVGPLASPQLTVQPRHQTMRATLDWSYKLLGSAEKSLLGRLSEFVSGWSLDAAVAIAGSDVPKSQTTSLLQSLVGKSLVVFDASKGRYRMLEPVRLYANEWAPDDLKNLASNLHQRWFVTLSEEAEAGIASSNLLFWNTRISQDHGNFLKAANWQGPASLPDAEQRITGNLWRYWYIHGEYEFGFRLMSAAVNRGSVATIEGLKCLAGLGQFAYSTTRSAEAKKIATKGVELASQADDLRRLGFFLNLLAVIAYVNGEVPEELFEQSLQIRLQVSDFQGAAITCCNLGNLYSRGGKHEQARSLYQRGFAFAETVGDMHSKAFLHLNAGDNEERLGNFEAARDHCEKCLEFHELIDSKYGIALSLSGLASLKRKQSEHEGASWMYRRALQIYRNQGELRNQALMLNELVSTSIAAGDRRTAHELNDECVTILRSLGISKEFASALTMQAELALARGDANTARLAVVECLECLRALDEENLLNQARIDFACLLDQQE